jgi:Leucine-rich repeat (LRR) protein
MCERIILEIFVSKGGATININFRGGSGSGGEKSSYPSSSRNHGGSGSDRNHGGSSNDGVDREGYLHNNSHGYSTRAPWHQIQEAADRYEAKKRQELEELRLAQEVSQQNELARQQEAQRVEEIKKIRKENQEAQEKQKAKNAPSGYELTPQYQEHQRKIAEAWADMYKRLALEKEVIHPQEDKIEFAEQQLRISKTVQELDGLKLNKSKHNAPEVEAQYPKITTTLKQYKADYVGFNKQVISDGIPIQALHTLSLKKLASVDSRVVDLVFDLLRDNHLPGLKTLDLGGNQRAIGPRQIDKLADSFYSGNNNLETLDISYAYTPRTDLRAKLPNTPVLKERLVKDLYSSGGSNELVKLIHSVALCNQPLCLTLEAGVLIQTSNPPEWVLYIVYMLFRNIDWMGEPESFKTTGVEMLNHIRQVFERAYQMDKKEQSAPPQIYNIGVTYKLPHLIDTFTWGITKCLTPSAFSSEDLGGLKDKLTAPYINMNKVYDVMQFTKTKLDTFLCVTEVVGDRIITHDMLNHQAKWKDAFPPDSYFNKNTPNKLGQYKITKQPISEGNGNTQPFDSSCRHCKESQFKYFFNTQSFLQKNDITTMINLNLSGGNLGDGEARIMAKLLKQGSLPNLKSLDVSGNQFSGVGNKYFAQAAKNIQQPIKILVDTIVNGLQKQLALGFGSKEAKQNVIKDWLKVGQDNGIDVKNVTVSKDISSKIDNTFNLTGNFLFGWAKCSIVPNSVKAFAADQIIAVASKNAGIVNTAIGVVTCYFETFDESASSQQGIQFMTDIGLVGQSEFLENIE